MSTTTTTPTLSLGLVNRRDDEATDWSPLFDLARAADRAGIDRVTVSDHVVFGEHIEAYGRPELGGRIGGVQLTGPDGQWLEPLTVLAMVAATTSRVRLQTRVLLAALRRPVVLAKTAATLDLLSGGRLDLGVGVGWQREEYDAAGLTFERRGTLLDHTLAVCQTLWRDRAASYDSEGLSFSSIHCRPAPSQEGGVPIWVSGTLNARVIERIVRFGAGWIPWGPDADDLPGSLPRLHEALASAGRDPAGLLVAGMLPEVTRADGTLDIDRSMTGVPAMVSAGVTDFRLTAPVENQGADPLEHLTALVTAFRRTVGRVDVD